MSHLGQRILHCCRRRLSVSKGKRKAISDRCLLRDLCNAWHAVLWVVVTCCCPILQYTLS